MSFSFLSELQNLLPGFLTGAERAKLIDKYLTHNDAWREEAYSALQNLMQQMRKLEASDIDLGGPGCDGYIWLRIYGIKAPHKKLGRYAEDEITCMLLSILTINQKQILLNSKNIDFSLSLALEENAVNLHDSEEIFILKPTRLWVTFAASTINFSTSVNWVYPMLSFAV